MGTLEEVWDKSRDPRRVPGQVWGPTRRPGMGRGTVGEVRDRSERDV